MKDDSIRYAAPSTTFRTFGALIAGTIVIAAITLSRAWVDTLNRSTSLVVDHHHVYSHGNAKTNALNDNDSDSDAVMTRSALEKQIHQLSESFNRMNASFFEKRSQERLQAQLLERDHQLNIMNSSFHEKMLQDQQKLQQLELQLHELRQQKQQHQEHVPQCDELMQAPHSPFQDGAFLTSYKTPVTWTPRADGSRQLDLDKICHLKRYTADEARMCLASKHISFIGDSVTRYQYLSFVHFLEQGTFPPRFGNDYQPCTHIDESGNETCSPLDKPNICVEHEWIPFTPPEFRPGDGWMYYYNNLGGGNDGGIINGRLECSCARSSAQDSCGASCVADNQLYTNGQSQAMVSFFGEFGWSENPTPLHGFNFSGCSELGTCRQSFDFHMARVNRSLAQDWDWSQPFPEAIGKNGSLREVLPRKPDFAFYNRGQWGVLPWERAAAIMPAMKDWVTSEGDSNGRCFYKSTAASYVSANRGYFKHEQLNVRPFAYKVGCEYLDYAYLTETFEAMGHEDSWWLSDERKSVYVDAVHFQPWVYEELNQVLLNVLCNTNSHDA